VIVGSIKASFIVHKSFVCNVSPFFQGACNSLFKEALSDEVYLPTADPDAFDIFMDWIYTRRIRYPKWPLDKTSQLDSEAWWLLVAKAYLLANYLQCTEFGNTLVDFISRSVTRKQVKSPPGSSVITLVYNSTMDDCGLRRLLVAWLVWRTESSSWNNEREIRSSFSGLPAEYACDVMIKSQKKQHKLDQDPFVNEKTCLVFHDKEIGNQVGKAASSREKQAAAPVLE
jgi:BTB/POZ domain